MKNVSKFFVISVGGLIALMVMGMIFSAVFDVKSEEIKGIDLIGDWMLYRIAFYVAVTAGWAPICRFMTKPRINPGVFDEDHARYAEKRERDVQYLTSQWWKVALIFVFFEVVIIQQFGL